MILPCFLIICLALCTNGLKLHEEMTKDEIHSTFGVPHHEVDSIEYEVTSLHHNEHPDNKGQKVRRARSTLQFAAFDRSFSLNLLENDILLGTETPLILANRGRDGKIYFDQRKFPMPNNMKLYHDVEKQAALATFTDEFNNTHVSGTVGDKYIIKSLPARLRNSNEHIIYKRNAQVNSARPLEAHYYNPSLNYQPTWDRQPITPQQPQYRPGVPSFERPGIHQAVDAEQINIVYPKILVAFDYDTYEKHGNDIYELSKYMAAFWNSVDLIFRELSQPQVRLNIAGFIVPQTRDSAPYFQKDSVKHTTLNSHTLLQEMKTFFIDEKHFDRSKFDIAIAITALDLSDPDASGVAGRAWLGQACQNLSFAVAEDRRSFDGVGVAAHELGHSLNVQHDGYKTSEACPESDGYIMSPSVTRGKNALRWSDCSKNSISEFLMSHNAKCMRQKPNVGTPYPRILPGKVYGRNEQCSKANGPGYVSTASESDCESLWCQIPSSRQSFPIVPAEGTPCGAGSICRNAQCVPDTTSNENMPVAGTPYYPTANGQHKPVVGTPYPTTQSGNAPSRDEQCSKLYGQNYFSVKDKEDSCEILHCQNGNLPNQNPSAIKSVAEGSSCGQGSICLNKQCVRDPTTANQQGPVIGISYPTNLPGNVPSRDEQCQTILGYGSSASKDGDNRCDYLWCVLRGSPAVHPGGNVAEGTPCGPRSICRNGQCV